MEMRKCEGGQCSDKLYEVGTVDQWVGRWKYKRDAGVVVYTSDPFAEEIHNEIIMMWLCEYCWYGIHDDI
jgi:hypothetical protein